MLFETRFNVMNTIQGHILAKAADGVRLPLCQSRDTIKHDSAVCTNAGRCRILCDALSGAVARVKLSFAILISSLEGRSGRTAP